MSHWRSSPCDARAQLPQSRWDTLKVMRARRAADRVFHRRRTGRTRLRLLRLVASNYRPEKIVFCESVSVSMPRRARGDHFHAHQ